MLVDIPNEYLENKSLLEIYSKSRDNFNYSNFALGYIIKDLGPYFIVKTIDDYGFLDSYTIMLKKDISRLNPKSAYLDLFKYYIRYNKSIDKFDPFNLALKFKDMPKDNLSNVLNYCYQNKKAINIYSDNSDYVKQGSILRFDKNNVILNELQYSRNVGTNDVESNEKTKLSSIMAIDILSKENFLYDQYLKNKMN
ncbi:hypothetical protein WR164_04040 [Philodulcilactobacillus myokoensis]|uniref:Uncharacterized protein n=1 Tax=Philodulcilactobacillus myokoensis TaxID=2929573 RepID=A0A9W6B0S5_9LACO|nr:hypothetical protein [Philodulcilactobacillus myokoensis]GLB46425.1 hypothetical protein WR164_04040 [Philodulcilactobacillus myokoensis]